MAIWVDISHLEPSSDEEDSTTGSSCNVGPTDLHFSYKSSLQDYGSHQDHATTTPIESAPYTEMVYSVSGREILAPEVSTITRSSVPVYHEHDRHDRCNIPQSQNHKERIRPYETSRKQYTSADQELQYCNVHRIAFRITSSDDTIVTTPSSYGEEKPNLYMADSDSVQSPSPYNVPESQEDFRPVYQATHLSDSSIDVEETLDSGEEVVGLGIDPDILRHRASAHALSMTTIDAETLIFINVSQEGFDCLLAASYASDDVESADGTLESAESDDYWPEFHYGETSASENPTVYGSPCVKEHNVEDDEPDTSRSPLFRTSNPANDFHLEDFPDELTTEVDIPLSHFQPLPIGPFTKSSPTKGHYHSFPTLTHDPTTQTITISHTMDEHFDCPIFTFGRHLAEVSSGPVPLLTRIHELQGIVEENRRGLKQSRRYRIWWRGMVRDVGSSLRVGLSM